MQGAGDVPQAHSLGVLSDSSLALCNVQRTSSFPCAKLLRATTAGDAVDIVEDGCKSYEKSTHSSNTSYRTAQKHFVDSW